MRSEDRILTTHTGSLPRPAELAELLERQDEGAVTDPGMAELVRAAVHDVVRKQVEAGVDVVNDGEAGKISYSTYVRERVDGFGGAAAPEPRDGPDWADFPEYMRSREGKGHELKRPACNGPVRYRDLDAVRADIANLDGRPGADARRRRFHDRGVAGRHRVVPAQPVLLH